MLANPTDYTNRHGSRHWEAQQLDVLTSKHRHENTSGDANNWITKELSRICCMLGGKNTHHIVWEVLEVFNPTLSPTIPWPQNRIPFVSCTSSLWCSGPIRGANCWRRIGEAMSSSACCSGEGNQRVWLFARGIKRHFISVDKTSATLSFKTDRVQIHDQKSFFF